MIGFAGMKAYSYVAPPVRPRALRIARFRGLCELLDARAYCIDAPSEMPAGSVVESGPFLNTHQFVFQSTFFRE